MKKLISLFLFLFITNFSVAQQETLVLDTSFGVDGVFIPEFPELDLFYINQNDFHILENDKVLISYSVGVISNPNYYSHLIYRFHSDGSLDSSYNSPLGYVMLSEINGVNLKNERLHNVELTEDDDLLVCLDHAIFRLNLDGSVDTSFGEGGIKTFEPAPRIMKGVKVINGSIYRLKSEDDFNNYYSYQRLLPNGDIDISYGSGGSSSPSFLFHDVYSDYEKYSYFTYWGMDGGFYHVHSRLVGNNSGHYYDNTLRANYYNPEGFLTNSHQIADSSYGIGHPTYGSAIVHGDDKLIINYGLQNNNITTYYSKRFNPDFSLDETYEFNEANSESSFAFKVFKTNSNKLWFYTILIASFEKIISRINDNGTYDTSFDENGTFSLSNLDLGLYGPRRIRDNSIYCDASYGRYFKLNVVENLSTQDIEKKDVNIYPNPATDKLYFENVKKSTIVKILNAEGKFIMEKTIQPNGFIDISALPKGVYVAVLDGNSYKFIKK